MKNNIILLCFSVLISLAISELVVRLIVPQSGYHDAMYQTESTRGWEFVPDREVRVVYSGGINHTINLNQDGFRDSDFRLKNEDAKVMVIGDSFVSNISVEDREVFTQVMEEQLSGTSVYNLGVNGYGQVQELLLLQEWLPLIDPDLIVLLIYLRNDFTDNVAKFPWLFPRPTATFGSDNEVLIKAPSFDGYKEKKKPPFYYKSHLYRFVKRRLNSLRSKTAEDSNNVFAPPEIYTCQVPLSDEIQAMYDTMQQLIGAIEHYARDHNTPIVFGLAPSMFQVQDDLWSQLQAYDPSVTLQRNLPNQKLLSFAEENNYTLIDLMPMLQEAHRDGAVLYNGQEQHWSAKGNELVANYLSTYLKEYLNSD